MTRKQYAFAFASMVMAGFLGGLMSGRIFTAQPILAQATHEKMIRAERFELVDKNGRVLAELGTRPAGVGDRTVGLILNGVKGHGEFRISVTEDGRPFLTMNDRNGSYRFGIIVGPDRNPEISFSGTDRSLMLLSMFDGPRLVFRDSNEKDRLSLGIGKAGEPYLRFNDKAGACKQESGEE